MKIEVDIPDEKLICPSCVAMQEQKRVAKSEHPCFECGEPAKENHHVIPRSMGGQKTIPLCCECHGKVHGVTNRCELINLSKRAINNKRENGGNVGGGVPFYMASSTNGDHYEPTKEGVEQLGRMIALFNAGTMQKEIARTLGFSEGTISKYKRRHETGKLQDDFNNAHLELS